MAHDPVEHIGVDHLARVNGSASASGRSIGGGSDVSFTAECLMGNFHAVQMLFKRLHFLRDYVDAAIRGELPLHPGRMREIRTLLSRLPRSVDLDSGEDDQEENSLLRQVNDVSLSSLLGGLTRALQSLYAWTLKEKLFILANTKDASVKKGTFFQRIRQNLKTSQLSRHPQPSAMDISTASAGDDSVGPNG